MKLCLPFSGYSAQFLKFIIGVIKLFLAISKHLGKKNISSQTGSETFLDIINVHFYFIVRSIILKGYKIMQYNFD
jgi:hypothetical protein